MNRLKFFKSLLGLGAVAVTTTAASALKPKQEFKFKAPPEFLNKWIEFDEDGLHYLVSLTTNVLIPLPEGGLEVNVYNEYCKVIARVSRLEKDGKTKFLKIEGHLLTTKQAKTTADNEVENIVRLAKLHFEKKGSTEYKLPLVSIVMD